MSLAGLWNSLSLGARSSRGSIRVTRDRIGKGPWQNAKGVVVAKSVEDLHSGSNNINKQTALTEKGEIVSGRGDAVNMHDILTGSDPQGLYSTAGGDTTCGNWTKSDEERRRIGHCGSLIMRHWNVIADTLHSGDIFLPLLLEDKNGISSANDWAKGFLRGMELRKTEWAALLDDEKHGGWLVPIFALAQEHNPDPEMRPYKGAISAEQREKLIVGAAAAVTGIYRYFEATRFVERQPFDNVTTFRRTAPKIGRNDPCPCGSGKKFKQCCGRTTLH